MTPIKSNNIGICWNMLEKMTSLSTKLQRTPIVLDFSELCGNIGFVILHANM
jgi:hypothetical protein